MSEPKSKTPERPLTNFAAVGPLSRMSTSENISSQTSVADSTITVTHGRVNPRSEKTKSDHPQSAQPAQLTEYPETDLDQGLVGWDGQDDPQNPQNFSSAKKWTLLFLISAVTFVSPLASSMFSPAVSYVGKDLHIENETLLSFTVSVYLIGYVVSFFQSLSQPPRQSFRVVVSFTVRVLIHSIGRSPSSGSSK
jgi:hypothetical protein